MRLFNKIVTTTALATMFITAAPSAQARIVSDYTNDDAQKTIRIKLKEVEDGSWVVISSRVLELGESELNNKTTQASPVQTQEEWNPTEGDLNRILAEAEAEEEAKAAATNKLQEEEKARVAEAEHSLKTVGTNLGQNLLAEKGVQEFLISLGGSSFLNKLQDKNAKSIRHRDEEEANFKKYGFREKNRRIERKIKNGKLVIK